MPLQLNKQSMYIQYKYSM